MTCNLFFVIIKLRFSEFKKKIINEQQNNYEKVKFVNMSLSSLGVFSQSSIGFTDMLKDLNIDEHCRK